MIAWKVYFLTSLGVTTWGTYLIFSGDPPFVEYFNSFFSLIGFVGLFGYAFKRKICRPGFWKGFAFFFIIWEAVRFFFDTQFSPGDTPLSDELLMTFLVLLFCLPGYIGIFLFAFRSNELWKEG